jgi:putative ABC transport system ATP-binding protein
MTTPTATTVEEAEVPDATASTAPANAPDTGPAWRALLRGLRSVPEFRAGLVGTLLLALVATVGRIVVPVAVQQTIDDGLRAAGGPDLGQVQRAAPISVRCSAPSRSRQSRWWRPASRRTG